MSAALSDMKANSVTAKEAEEEAKKKKEEEEKAKAKKVNQRDVICGLCDQCEMA